MSVHYITTQEIDQLTSNWDQIFDPESIIGHESYDCPVTYVVSKDQVSVEWYPLSWN